MKSIPVVAVGSPQIPQGTPESEWDDWYSMHAIGHLKLREDAYDMLVRQMQEGAKTSSPLHMNYVIIRGPGKPLAVSIGLPEAKPK